MKEKQRYRSDFWYEEEETDNPFATRNAYCHGYDVYGEVLQKATWFEYLFLIFKGEKPTATQKLLLEKLAMMLLNPGLREASARAAMNGGVAGSPHAETLICALAVGSGCYGGGYEVYTQVNLWQTCSTDLELWINALKNPNPDPRADIWPKFEHPPGFDPNGVSCTTPVKQCLELFSSIYPEGSLEWLRGNRLELEAATKMPLAMSAVAACAFYELGFDADQACMLYSILRLPGTAAHALEQKKLGWKNFPYYGNNINLDEDVEVKPMPKLDRIKL